MRYFGLGVFVFLSLVMTCATYMQVTGTAFPKMWPFVLVVFWLGMIAISLASFSGSKQ